MTIAEVLPIVGSTDCVVLGDYSTRKTGRFENLLRCTETGNVVWRAELPQHNDGAYVEARWQGKELRANTWDGWLVSLDPSTGKIISVQFVK